MIWKVSEFIIERNGAFPVSNRENKSSLARLFKLKLICDVCSPKMSKNWYPNPPKTGFLKCTIHGFLRKRFHWKKSSGHALLHDGTGKALCCLAYGELAWLFHELHIQGGITVWICYCHALKKGYLEGRGRGKSIEKGDEAFAQSLERFFYSSRDIRFHPFSTLSHIRSG